MPASPPSVVIPPAPAAPVTVPVANALVMLPVLNATSPPAVPFEPTFTEREKAIQHAIDVMEKGLPWGGTLRRFRRDEMHEQR